MPQGPRHLLAGGARELFVVGPGPSIEGAQTISGVPEIPVEDGSIDVVACIEPYASYGAPLRRRLLREVHRVLRPGGMLAAWVAHSPDDPSHADFWTMEEELADVFTRSAMVAQIPWHGFSLAPIVDDDRSPRVAIVEALLHQAPEASHYLALSFRGSADPETLERLQTECVLVPIPGEVPEEEDVEGPAKLSELEELLSTRETDLRVLTANVTALEESLAKASEKAEARARELEKLQRQTRELETRRDELHQDLEARTHELELAVTERSGQRTLTERLEAELDVARRRLQDQIDQVAVRTADASRLQGELQAVRERLAAAEQRLDDSRSRTEALTASAAKQDEQGRMLAEVASDRDRLREELSRRANEIHRLEERLWEAREEVQKERLESVRLSGSVERLEDQSQRARQAEQEGRGRIEELSAELRRLEVARADADAALRSRDEQLTKLRHDAETLQSESADLHDVQRELRERSRELGELSGQLEQARAREQDAAARLRKRDEQLSQAGAELQSLRRTTDQDSSSVKALQNELDVKALEVEQLAASVGNLQRQVEEQRSLRTAADERTSGLQRRLESATAELEELRKRVRQRDQELNDLNSAQETDSMELYKLRQELESTAQLNERLDGGRKAPDPGSTSEQEGSWPDDAVAEVRRLRGAMAAQIRRHAEQVQQLEKARATGGGARDEDLYDELQRARLESAVRAEEQEHILALLESAEQKIWEMNDAADRSAARLAASLAQLEKNKEQLDETQDELEVTRNLVGAAQARALEFERLLGSERAKLMRAGIDPDGLPTKDLPGGELDDVFADLSEEGRPMVELASRDAGVPTFEEGAPTQLIRDRSGSIGGTGPRIVVEALEEDDAWDDMLEEGGAAPSPIVRVPTDLLIDGEPRSLRPRPPPRVSSDDEPKEASLERKSSVAPGGPPPEGEPTIPRLRLGKLTRDANEELEGQRTQKHPITRPSGTKGSSQ